MVQPAGVPRNEVFTNIRVAPAVEDSSASSGVRASSERPGVFASLVGMVTPSTENRYILSQRRGGGFELAHAGTTTPIAYIPSRGTVNIGSVIFSLPSKADSLQSIVFSFPPFVAPF